jgi:putative redox protein
MVVNTSWGGKRAFLSKCPSGFEVKMDATENYGGDGKGLTPMELILVGVAGCIGIDVTMLLGKNIENISKIDIQTEGLRREEMPTSFIKIRTTFIVEGEIDAQRFWKAIRLGHNKYCAVSDSLKSEMIYHLKLNGEEINENAL